MRCDEARLVLYALEDGEQGAARCSDVLAHVEGCAACRHERQADRRVKALVRQHASASPGAPPGLWPRLIARLEAEPAPTPGGVRRPVPARSRPVWWPSALAAAAVAAIMVLGVLLQWVPSSNTLAQLLDELVSDHVGSLHRAGGPADVRSSDPAVILTRFADRISGLDPPRLAAGTANLVGGSFCQLRTTRGIRWTYRLHSDRTLSFYQLARLRGDLLRPRAERITLAGRAENTALLLWTDERSLYALVGALPMGELEALAAHF